MNAKTFIILTILAFSGNCHAEGTNSFGIYLTTGPEDTSITTGKGDWSRLDHSAVPLITAKDIVSYDFEKHSLRLRPGVLARLPSPPVWGRPFIVVVNGERIYLGAFTTSNSSHSCAIPSITVDRQNLVPNQPADTLVIDRAYPTPAFAIGADPRGDPRIKAALKALGKLKDAK